MVLQSIENSKAQVDEFDALANNENEQIQQAAQKEQNDTKKEDKMIHDLNESIRQAEQQLRQVVSTIFDRLLW